MGYTVKLEDIIKNLTAEEIRLLDYLNIQNTDRFNGINITDMLEDELIIAIGVKHTKLNSMLDRLRVIDAIGMTINGRYHYYYIKTVGTQIIELLGQE